MNDRCGVSRADVRQRPAGFLGRDGKDKRPVSVGGSGPEARQEGLAGPPRRDAVISQAGPSKPRRRDDTLAVRWHRALPSACERAVILE
jgi:hypothetical protein